MSIALHQVNFKLHPITLFADEMRHLIDPLNDIAKINHFSYEKITSNNGQKEIVFLTTHPAFTQHIFMPNKLYELAYCGDVERYKDGFYLWSFFEDDLVYKKTFENLGMKNGITIVKKEKDFCEFYFFASSEKSPLINYFFLNNKELFESFTYYFKEKGKYMLQLAEKHKIIMPASSDDKTVLHAQKYLDTIANKTANMKQELFADFKIDTLIKKCFGTRLERTQLTHREYQCVSYLIHGHNAKQIARKLDVSTRTIEKHFEHLKEKTKTHSVLELVVKLLSA